MAADKAEAAGNTLCILKADNEVCRHSGRKDLYGFISDTIKPKTCPKVKRVDYPLSQICWDVI